jgi:CrcB protein
MLGAWLRYGLGLWLNPVCPQCRWVRWPPTWSAPTWSARRSWSFHINADLPPEFKLFFITGFLGALTTFSTFSAEVVAMIQRADYGWAWAPPRCTCSARCC